jgi:hypothetical protein
METFGGNKKQVALACVAHAGTARPERLMAPGFVLTHLGHCDLNPDNLIRRFAASHCVARSPFRQENVDSGEDRALRVARRRKRVGRPAADEAALAPFSPGF